MMVLRGDADGNDLRDTSRAYPTTVVEAHF